MDVSTVYLSHNAAGGLSVKRSMYLLICTLVFLAGCQKKLTNNGFHLAPSRPDRIDENILPKEEGQAITIFVHGGARPLSSLIPLPGLHSKCPRGLMLAKDLGADCVLGKKVGMTLSAADPEMFPRDSFYNFGWSGFLSFTARENAGQELYDILCQLRSDKRYVNSSITIVSFSHGGNVVLNAALTACAKGDTRALVDLAVMTACPVVVPTQDFVASPTFKKVIVLYSKSDAFQVLDPQGLYPSMGDLPCEGIFSKRRFDESEHLIQAEVKINNKSQTGHLGFTSRRFLRALPRIIKLLSDKEELKKLPRYKNSSYCITINTKENEVTGCKPLSVWKRERRLRPIKGHANAGCAVCAQLLQSSER